MMISKMNIISYKKLTFFIYIKYINDSDCIIKSVKKWKINDLNVTDRLKLVQENIETIF